MWRVDECLGTIFSRQNLASVDVNSQFSLCTGIPMNQKDDFELKQPFGLHGLYKHMLAFQVLRVND